MAIDHANTSIKCNVASCVHHCNNQQFCSLNEITVGCCGAKVCDCKETECASFQPDGNTTGAH